MNILDTTRAKVRSFMRMLAKGLHKVSGGKVTPNIVTLVSVLAYIPIAYYIAKGEFVLAVGLHVVFGSMDMLDGELARLTKKANQYGALWDASSDRIKIGLVMAGAAQYMALNGQAEYVYVPVMAAVVAATVAYVKAKGEVGVALKEKGMDHHKINHVFKEGLIPYDLLNIYIIAMITGEVLAVSWAILILGVVTYVWLLSKVNARIN